MHLIDPFPGLYDVADPFGAVIGRTYPHTGSDWKAGGGSPAPAIGSGVVVSRQWHAGNGHTVTVRLDDGHYFAYLHMHDPAIVAVGDRVTIGQPLGYVGNTGTNSRGNHLHVTVSDSPQAYIGLGNKLDPWAFIQQHLSTKTTAAGTARPLTDQEEDDDMSTTIYKATSTAGYIFAGWRFIQEPNGALRAFSDFEWKAYDEAHPNAKVVERTGAQLYDLSKRVGLHEFTGDQQTGPRGLTGRLIGRSADLNNPDGSETRHFPRIETGAWPAKVA